MPKPHAAYYWAVLIVWGLLTGCATAPSKQTLQRGSTRCQSEPQCVATDNPFKKMKPHPDDPSKVIYRDPHTGKRGERAKPPGFDEWWNSRK
jgi:hypothetical protein